MGTEALQLRGFIPFPCHKQQKKLVFYGASGIVSDKCPQCGGFALFDLDRMRAENFHPLKGAVSRINNELNNI